MGVLLKQDISAVSFQHLQLQNLDGPVTLWGRQRMILDLLNIQPRQYLSVVQDDLFVKIKQRSLSIPDLSAFSPDCISGSGTLYSRSSLSHL